MISIAIAQSPSVRGDFDANIACHARFAEKAAREGGRIIVFPELSLTGYEPELAAGLAVRPGDERLKPLQLLSEQLDIIIAAGAPVLNEDEGIHIGTLVLFPDGSVQTYFKQVLHGDEKLVFSPGQKDCIFGLSDEKIGLAICADLSDPELALRAAGLGATIYAVSVLVSFNGYKKDAEALRLAASRHRMTVFMANHCRETGGYMPAGRSAVWDITGRMLVQCRGTEEALIIAVKKPEGWICRIKHL